MALVRAFDDAKINAVRRSGDGKDTVGGILSTRFFGSRDRPDLPYANLTRQDPGRSSVPHFHIRDQFQVIVEGKGKIGKHELYPHCVHFARAYTPYGPLVADAETGFTFFVMRARPDPGSQSIAEFGHKLKDVPDRQPWQITHPVSFPANTGADTLLQAVPEISDEQGLAAYTLSMKPDAQIQTPDATRGDGQYIAVIRGSLLHDGKEHKAPALAFVFPHEHTFSLCAGAQGLAALVLNFPRPRCGE